MSPVTVEVSCVITEVVCEDKKVRICLADKIVDVVRELLPEANIFCRIVDFGPGSVFRTSRRPAKSVSRKKLPDDGLNIIDGVESGPRE